MVIAANGETMVRSVVHMRLMWTMMTVDHTTTPTRTYVRCARTTMHDGLPHKVRVRAQQRATNDASLSRIPD